MRSQPGSQTIVFRPFLLWYLLRIASTLAFGVFCVIRAATTAQYAWWLGAGIALVVSVRVALWYANHAIILDETGLTFRSGRWRVREVYVPLPWVELDIRQGPLGRLFDYATVAQHGGPTLLVAREIATLRALRLLVYERKHQLMTGITMLPVEERPHLFRDFPADQEAQQSTRRRADHGNGSRYNARVQMEPQTRKRRKRASPDPHPLMESKQFVGALGAVILLGGVFAPMISIGLPVAVALRKPRERVSFSYYAYSAIVGGGAWLILVGLASAGLLIALTRVYLFLLFTGIVSLGMIAVTAIDLYVYATTLLTKLPGPIRISLDQIVQPTWGCVPLVLGPILMLISTGMRSPRRT